VTTLLPELDHLLYGDPQMVIDGVSSGKLCILDGKLQYKPLTGLTPDSPVISSEVVEIIKRLESLKVCNTYCVAPLFSLLMTVCVGTGGRLVAMASSYSTR
jgi:hypothetical protein